MHPTTIHAAVDACQRGEHERCIAKLHSGWVVLAEKQVLPGYCLLLSDPVVRHLNDLTGDALQHFLMDMAHVGEAVLRATEARRINYEILCNQDEALHAHIIPRFTDEAPELRTRPVWFYDIEAAEAFSPDLHRDLVWRIREHVV